MIVKQLLRCEINSTNFNLELKKMLNSSHSFGKLEGKPEKWQLAFYPEKAAVPSLAS